MFRPMFSCAVAIIIQDCTACVRQREKRRLLKKMRFKV